MGAGEVQVVNIIIRFSNRSKLFLVGLGATVADFKVVLAQSCDIPLDQQRLIYKGLILKDDQTLDSYGLQAYHTVHMVRGPTTSSPPDAATPNISNATAVPSESVGFGSSLIPELGLNVSEQVQQQLTQNPNMIRELMNTLVIQSLMNNPDLVRDLIMNNPQMRDNIDLNPIRSRILNDPNTFRKMLEAIRNPAIMREMTRNLDRAMSHLESSSEGFNALRRMHEKSQKRFLNDCETRLNRFEVLLCGGAQTRDESNNLSNVVSETNTGSAIPNSDPLPNPWGGAIQVNTTARSNPIGDATTRPPGIAGLGGFRLPELTMGQLLRNPDVSQMMQSTLSNPQHLNQFRNSNPQVRGMLDMNPQLREMIQNPEFLRQLFSPETVQQLYRTQQEVLTQIEVLEAQIEALKAEKAQLIAKKAEKAQKIAEKDEIAQIRAHSEALEAENAILSAQTEVGPSDPSLRVDTEARPSDPSLRVDDLLHFVPRP